MRGRVNAGVLTLVVLVLVAPTGACAGARHQRPAPYTVYSIRCLAHARQGLTLPSDRA